MSAAHLSYCSASSRKYLSTVFAVSTRQISLSVLDVIVSLADQGKTMLIVTHEMSFARAVADRIILLEDRNILEESDPETFFTSPKTEQAKKFLQSFEFNRKNKAEA